MAKTSEQTEDQKTNGLTQDEFVAAMNRIITLEKQKKALADQIKEVTHTLKGRGLKIGNIQTAKKYFTMDDATAAEDIAEQLKLMRWLGVPLGGQLDLFKFSENEDKVASFFHEAGRRAAVRGDACEVPDTVPPDKHQEWIGGWQAAEKQRKDGAKKLAE